MHRFGKWKKHRQEPEQVSVDIPAPTNSYYESVSERYGIAQVILYLSLLAFVAVSLLSNTGLITYQNLYYFFKDLNASAENVDVIHTDAVSYPSDASQSFALYRKGLAVAGNNSVTVFTSAGRQSISKNHLYQNPVAVGSGKYLLVYDLGGTQYSLYNSYTRIYSGKAENTIRGGAISSSGIYALITNSRQATSVVELYNSRFDPVNRYSYYSYVTDVSISEKGNYIAVLLSGVENGIFSTDLRIYEPGKSEVFSQMNICNSLGLSCEFTSSGDLALLCGNGVYYATVRGKLIAEMDFEGKNIVCADSGSEGCAVILKKSDNLQEFLAIVFDKSGKMLYNKDIVGEPDSVALCENMLFLMQSDGIMRINLSDGTQTTVKCNTDQRVMLAVDQTRVMLCSSKKADTYRFGN